ncbi:hypothetical protein B0H13DRAFT_2368968 [Mycena leptocephala]|nr:hypothetical protein B0H13DRAFT_2368968 [Mycena leptocephala]
MSTHNNLNPCRAVVLFMPVWRPQGPRALVRAPLIPTASEMPGLISCVEADSDDDVPDLISEEEFVKRSILMVTSWSIDASFKLKARTKSAAVPSKHIDLQCGERLLWDQLIFPDPKDSDLQLQATMTYDYSCMQKCNCRCHSDAGLRAKL